MKTPLDAGAVRAGLNADREFRIQSRYWNTRFHLEVTGMQSMLVKVVDGEVVEIDELATPFDAWDFQLVGSPELWNQMLEATPAPFFQDYYPAMLYHGFKIEGDMQRIMAYYPAIRRSLEVLRKLPATEEVTA